MLPDVRRQRGALCKCLPTELADVWALPTVDPLVSPQGAGTWEGLPTDAAGVWSDARMAPHVGLNVLEGVSTDVANLTFFPVTLQVAGQRLRWQQTLTANSTDRL